ncbi:MAG: TasA family protein [Candidatus Moranbacteria bacterium]|nr:TasA family protein [Candidatus Moranbacteria bacterium]
MKNIIKSLVVVIAVSAIAGYVTYSEFSSSATATNNTFSTGTLDLEINNDGGSDYYKTISNTWESPSNWAPGEKVDGTIHMTNIGSINSHHVYFGFNSPTHGGGSNSINLMDKIIVTKLTETFNDTHTTADQSTTLAHQVGNYDGVLTLAELVGFNPSGFGYYSVDDQSGDGIILGAGNQKDYSIYFEFQFDPNAGNDYQNAQCGFTLNLNATQNSSTDGMLRI